MTITQLSYVLAVAENKNFTKAAEKCFVTQPTLSMQIQKLEEQLNVLIFDRSKKPIELTSVGEKIVIQARNIVNESYRIQDIVDQEKGFIGGEFTLGIIPTVMPTLLPMFLKNFVKKHTKVKLKIEELTTSEMVTKIKDGHLDAAIAATPLEEENIKERVLYFEPFMGYIPKGHALYDYKKIDVTDLDINTMLLLRDGHCFRDGVINLCNIYKTHTSDSFKLESGNIETLIKLSNEGLGMTILPYLHTLNMHPHEKENIKHFKEPLPAREVSIIYHKSELKIQIIEALQDVISNSIRRSIAFQNVKIISPLKKQTH